jgi:hypothetical protein
LCVAREVEIVNTGDRCRAIVLFLAVSFSLCSRDFQALLKIRPSSLLKLLGFISNETDKIPETTV